MASNRRSLLPRRSLFRRSQQPSAAKQAVAGHEAEFERIRRRLRFAVGALMLVTLVGVFGFLLIGRGEHGLIDAIYMTVITLTTVGFGEVIDMSSNPAGRIFTIGLLLVGMGIVAYTVPMLAAFFIEGHLHHIFRRRRMQSTIAELTNHYIVCGDEATSWYVVEELVRTQRVTVLVTPTEEALKSMPDTLSELPTIAGDPTSDQVLTAAGVQRAAGVVFAMESDKDNVLGVLTARQLSPGARIVAATEHQESGEKLRAAGADAVVSPSRIGGLRMASELVRPKVVSFLDQMLREKGGSLRVEEVSVPASSPLASQPLGALRINDVEGVVLLAIRGSEGFEFNPKPDTRLEPGMALIVMADASGRMRLEQRIRS